MKQDRRGSWYLLTGAVLGVAFGLFYSWVISPVKYVDAPPYALRADFKDEYRALVAAAYLYSGDLVRAQDRLAQLKDDETSQTIVMQAQRALAEGRPEEEIRALGILAMALGEGVAPVSSRVTPTQAETSIPPTSAITPTPLLIGPTANLTITLQTSPTASNTLQPPITARGSRPTNTATPTPTQGAPFVLQDQKLVCNSDQPEPLIQVEILDAAEQPVPSVEMVVSWDGGEDHFFTGLKPELGLGYGDFVMTPEVVYSIRLADGGQAVNDLTVAACLADDDSRYWGSWFLTFVQP
ncbi:MAG: hypothetical protein WAM09_00445 [Anaerolineales bacterium]